MVTRPTPTSLPGLELGPSKVGLELGSSSVGLVAVVDVFASSSLAPVTSLKIVVESSCGLYESTPNEVGFPVALS